MKRNSIVSLVKIPSPSNLQNVFTSLKFFLRPYISQPRSKCVPWEKKWVRQAQLSSNCSTLLLKMWKMQKASDLFVCCGLL